jgi:hypothetical protein
MSARARGRGVPGWLDSKRMGFALLLLLLLLLLLGAPLFAWAGSYQARCADQQACEVRLSATQLSVDGQVIPTAAITGWSKSGPGVQSDPALGAAATILLGAPGRLLYGSGRYLETFTIRYTTAAGQAAVVSFAFQQVDQGRFFETELLAHTGLPMSLPPANPGPEP